MKNRNGLVVVRPLLSGPSSNQFAPASHDDLPAMDNDDYRRGKLTNHKVIDDILDVTQTSEKLGKTAGKDTQAQKATYPAIVGLEKSRKIATDLTHKAFAALKPFRGKAVALEALAGYLLKRDH